MFSLYSFSSVQCISLDFFSAALKWIEQQNLHLSFSERLNEEELRCVDSVQSRSLEYRWNCCDYNPTLSLQIFIFPNPEGLCMCVCISILLWIRVAPRPSWDVTAHSWMGQDQAWHGAHGPSKCLPQQRSSSLLAIARGAIPSPNFILSIPQETKRLWVTGQSRGELFRVKAQLGCMVPSPMDSTLPSVKALLQRRMELKLTKIFLIEVLNYWTGIHHLTGKRLAQNDSLANKCLSSYT